MTLCRPAEGLKQIGYLVWPLSQPQSQKPVFDFVPVPGDLTLRIWTWGMNFCHNNGSESYWDWVCGAGVLNTNGGAARRRFIRYSRKTGGEGI